MSKTGHQISKTWKTSIHKDCNNQEEKLIESDHEVSDGSENEESNVPDGESVLLTDVDYDDDFLTDNYYGL